MRIEQQGGHAPACGARRWLDRRVMRREPVEADREGAFGSTK